MRGVTLIRYDSLAESRRLYEFSRTIRRVRWGAKLRAMNREIQECEAVLSDRMSERGE